MAHPPPLMTSLSQQAKDSLCNDAAKASDIDDFDAISFEVGILIVVSHVLHYVLKRLNQPSVVSHMIAGLLIGRTVLNNIPAFYKKIHKIDDDDHLMSMASIGSAFFMFLVGLEMDFQFLLRSIRGASFVTLGSTVTCIAIAIIVGPSMYAVISINGGRLLFVFILVALFSNSASPILIRMMTELEVTMSKVGRIGISAALVNDIASLFIIAVVVLCPMPDTEYNSSMNKFQSGVLGLALIIASAWILRVIVQFINRMGRSKLRKIIWKEGMWVLMIIVIKVTTVSEELGYPSMMAAFIIGLAFPRDGPTTRTLVNNLSFGVNSFILPIYFGYAGVQTDLFMLSEKKVLIMVATIVIFGTTAKVFGTLLVAKYILKMQMREGLVLGFMLNVKGHVELIILAFGRKYGIWGKEIYQALLISMLFSNLAVGPAAAYIARRERRARKSQSAGLQWLDLDEELRIVSCVHSSHDIPTTMDLIQITSGTDHTPLTPYIMHIVEIAEHVTTTSVLYNEIKDDERRNNENARLVNEAVDMYNTETGIKLRQLTVLSSFATMHRDIYKMLQEIRATMIVVPYYRKQRFDGTMGTGKDQVKELNMNVLRKSPCTVGILVDRGLNRQFGTASDEQKPYQVAVLFLGGPDDREAVAYGTRLAMHPSVSVTLMRFMPMFRNDRKLQRISSVSTDSSENYAVLMEMEMECAGDPDEEFMENVHNRFVSTGKIMYVVEIVDQSAEIVTTLAAMKGMYSLVIVGRQRQGPTAQLTFGMSEGEECQEFGAIGDLLTTSDFMSIGSVLVVQQHSASNTVKNGLLEEDEEFDEFKL